MDESLGPVVCKWKDCINKYDSPEELAEHLGLDLPLDAVLQESEAIG